MSSGVIIEVEFAGEKRHIIPFIPFENETFPNNLRKRIVAVLRAERDYDILDMPHVDPNYDIINVAVVKLVEELEKSDKVNCAQCFHMAGQFWKIIQNPPYCTYSEYRANLEHLHAIITSRKIDPLTPGYEQYIARLNHAILFEDRIVTYDNYAMYLEDFAIDHSNESTR